MQPLTWAIQFASLQFVIKWYGMGKTSVESRLNIPGRLGWMTMEVPGFIALLHTMYSVSEKYEIEDLPWQNKVLAGLFVGFFFFFLFFSAKMTFPHTNIFGRRSTSNPEATHFFFVLFFR